MDRNELTLEPCHLGVPSGAPKQFLRLWYIWRKPCTCLALKLTLSPNRPKRAPIWASSPRSTIRCIQNNFWAYGIYGANHAPIMHRNQHSLQKGPKGDSTWPTLPRSSIGCVRNDFWGYGMFGANCGTILHRDSHYLQMDRNEILHDPRNLAVPSAASKMISEITVRSVQTVHLSWSKISLISKRTETSFHLSLVT
jgi:hypothetical protein